MCLVALYLLAHIWLVRIFCALSLHFQAISIFYQILASLRVKLCFPSIC